MDHIQILFKEYDTLRSELTTRTAGNYQFIGIGAALVVATLSLAASGHVDGRILVAVVCAVIILVGFVLATFRDISMIAARVRELEMAINTLAGAELLEWETKWGSGATGWIFRSKTTK